MTTKKSKVNDVRHKTDFTKFKPQEVKKNQYQNTKRINTFLPVSNEEAPKTK